MRMSTGWLAVGFAPTTLEQARLKHERRVAAAQATNSPAPGNWNPESYMRNASPDLIRAAPFASKSAAEDAVRVATRCGWRGCYVRSKR